MDPYGPFIFTSLFILRGQVVAKIITLAFFLSYTNLTVTFNNFLIKRL